MTQHEFCFVYNGTKAVNHKDNKSVGRSLQVHVDGSPGGKRLWIRANTSAPYRRWFITEKKTPVMYSSHRDPRGPLQITEHAHYSFPGRSGNQALPQTHRGRKQQATQTITRAQQAVEETCGPSENSSPLNKQIERNSRRQNCTNMKRRIHEKERKLIQRFRDWEIEE